eukprot:2393960-Pyramimonas_sp.AAC.1
MEFKWCIGVMLIKGWEFLEADADDASIALMRDISPGPWRQQHHGVIAYPLVEMARMVPVLRVDDATSTEIFEMIAQRRCLQWDGNEMEFFSTSLETLLCEWQKLHGRIPVEVPPVMYKCGTAFLSELLHGRAGHPRWAYIHCCPLTMRNRRQALL